MPAWALAIILIVPSALGGLLFYWLLFDRHAEPDLEPGEQLIKDQAAHFMIDRKQSAFGNGRAFLTDRRIVWIRGRLPLPVGLQHETILLSEIDDIDRGPPLRWLGPQTLLVRAQGHTYEFAFDPIFSEGRAEWERLLSRLLPAEVKQ